MARKEFNFKEFMLRHGERVGLGVAGALGGLFLVLGLLNWVGSKSNASHADELSKTADSKKQEMQRATPEPTLSYVDPRLGEQVEADQVDARNYPLFYQPINPKPVEDTKRRPPHLLAPEEWAADVVMASLRSLQFNEDRSKVYLVQGGKPARTAGTNGFYIPGSAKQGSGSKGGSPGTGSGGGFAPGGAGGMGPGGPGGDRGPGGGMGGPPFGGMAGQQGGNRGSIVPLPVDAQLPSNARFAELPEPRCIAVIVGAFPYKQQMEEYQKKLHYKTLEEYVQAEGEPQFKAIKVMRKVIKPSGEVIDFQPYDIGQQIVDCMVKTNGQKEDDDDQTMWESLWGLVSPRPKLMAEEKTGQNDPNSHYPHVQYPNVEKRLTLLNKSFETFKAKVKPKALPKVKITNPEKFDAFNPTGVAAPKEGNQQLFQAEKGVSFEDLIPTYKLVRFLDTQCVPGETYEYMVKFVAVNPNFKKQNVVSERQSKQEEIESDWFLVTAKGGGPLNVHVPSAVNIYALNEKPERGSLVEPLSGQVPLQVQRWVDYFFPNPADRQTVERLGDWLVAESVKVYRGELANRHVTLRVPRYDPLEDDFVLAVNGRKQPFIDVPMGPENADVILLDFEGGRVSYQRPGSGDGKPGQVVHAKAPYEVIIFTPDGKLSGHEEDVDTNDKVRKERLDEYRKRRDSFTPGGRRPS